MVTVSGGHLYYSLLSTGLGIWTKHAVTSHQDVSFWTLAHVQDDNLRQEFFSSNLWFNQLGVWEWIREHSEVKAWMFLVCLEVRAGVQETQAAATQLTVLRRVNWKLRGRYGSQEDGCLKMNTVNITLHTVEGKASLTGSDHNSLLSGPYHWWNIQWVEEISPSVPLEFKLVMMALCFLLSQQSRLKSL